MNGRLIRQGLDHWGHGLGGVTSFAEALGEGFVALGIPVEISPRYLVVDALCVERVPHVPLCEAAVMSECMDADCAEQALVVRQPCPARSPAGGIALRKRGVANPRTH
jgi:hypothetical protein